MIDRGSFPSLVPKRAHNFDFTFFFLQREISPSKRSPPTFSCVSSIHHNAYRRPSHTASSFNYKLPFTDMHRRHFFHAFRASSFHCLKTYPLYRCPPYFIFFDMRYFSFVFQPYQCVLPTRQIPNLYHPSEDHL